MLETLLVARAVLYGRPVRLHAPRSTCGETERTADTRLNKRGAFLSVARKMSQLITSRMPK